MARKTIAALNLEVEALTEELSAIRQCSAQPELVDELVALKLDLKKKACEIQELQIENEDLAHRLAELPVAEDLCLRLSCALLSAISDVGRTVLGPLNTVELVTEALEHGHVKLVKA
jgi:hypothetical protein